MAYRGLIPGRFPTEELKRSRVIEITPDIWMIEGYISSPLTPRSLKGQGLHVRELNR